MFKKADKIIDTISEFIAATGIISGVVLAFVNVVARYAFNKSFTWSAELTMYFFLWSIFFGSVYCFKKDAHISINILVEKLNKKIAKIIMLISYLITLVFLIFVAYYGYKYLQLVIELDEKSIDLNIPMWIPYSVIPISFLFSSYKIIGKIITTIKTPYKELKIKSDENDFIEKNSLNLDEIHKKTGGLL